MFLRTSIRGSSALFISSRSFAVGRVLRNSSMETVPKVQATSTDSTTVVSFCKAGTPLNLKIFKKGDEPVAMEDSEYPAWLWEMTDASKNMENIKNENFLRWRRIKLSKQNNQIIKNNNFLSKT